MSTPAKKAPTPPDVPPGPAFAESPPRKPRAGSGLTTGRKDSIGPHDVGFLRARRRAVVGPLRTDAASRPGDAGQPDEGAAVCRHRLLPGRRAGPVDHPRLAGRSQGLQYGRL